MAEKKLQPIIIKRVKKGGHAAHGGAWKIAYADFVTAMMAFFLLMWLLGSTANGELKGIAEFFQNPLKVGMSGGSGAGDATSILNGGGKDLTSSAELNPYSKVILREVGLAHTSVTNKVCYSGQTDAV